LPVLLDEAQAFELSPQSVRLGAPVAWLADQSEVPYSELALALLAHWRSITPAASVGADD
jgi:hypothetical protein